MTTDQQTETDDDNTNMNECDRCEDNYESYTVLIPDNITEIIASQRCEYDNLCKPCRMAVTDYGAYLTETERQELEPKTEVN